MYKIYYTKRAVKDIDKLKNSKLQEKAKNLIDFIKNDPYETPPRYEKLVGNLSGAYSRRINLKHRLVYQVYEEEKIIKIISMWTHYDI